MHGNLSRILRGNPPAGANISYLGPLLGYFKAAI